MKITRKSFIWGFSAAVLVSAVMVLPCLAEDQARSTSGFSVEPVEYVVFIGFDGLSARAVERAGTPTFGRLMREGAWTLSSRSILPSASSCNWHSIFTCAASEQHGYVEWNSKEPAFAPSALNGHGVFPDIFSELARQRPQAESTFIFEWSGMQYTIDTNAVTHLLQRARSIVPKYIATMKPGILAAVVNSPDDKGHQFGWDSPEYAQCVKELDAWLGDVLGAIESAGIADRTVLFVTSDHGGEDTKHGRATLADMERPVLMWGANVRKGRRLDFGGAVYDAGATVAALLGLDFPRAWIGRPLYEAFEH